METIILDTNAPAADALKAGQINLNIDLDQQALQINGKQYVPYQGAEMDFPLNYNYSIRGVELAAMIAQQLDGDEKTKNEAKLALSGTALAAIKLALTTYLQGVYVLDNPA